MKRETLIIMTGALVILGIVLLFLSYTWSSHKVPAMSRCQNKIVYTLDQAVDKAPLRVDCARRKGKFNACGSVCSKKGEMIITVCAVTCEFK